MPGAIPAHPDRVFRPLVVVTGKGGVGKTTIAAMIAAEAARRGRRVLMVEVASRNDAERVAPWLARTPVEHRSLASRSALDAYLRAHLPLGPLLTLLPRTAFGVLAAATPGLAELLVLGQVWELARSGRYDSVVLDAPATGHALAMLAAPQTFAAAVGSGPVVTQARAIDVFLRAPLRTAYVGVTRAEELAVNETVVLQDGLRARLGVRLGEVVVNAAYPQRFSPAEAASLRGAPDSPARRAALHIHVRAREHARQLGRLRTALEDGVPVTIVPYRFGRPGTAAAAVAA